MSSRSTRRQAAGFSLIELMIAIAIIGLLAAFATPAYRGYVANTQEAMVQNQFRDAIRFARSKAAQLHAFPSSAQADMVPANAQGWVEELNPRGAQAAGGGPAYVAGAADPATGAIGIEAEGSFVGGTAVLRIHRPQYGSISAEMAEIAISAW